MVERGAVVMAVLDPTLGHEQRGTRPCVVVSDPVVSESQKFPLICVVPVTTTAAQGLLYPPLAAVAGLMRASFALVDQVRAIDKRRVVRWCGRIGDGELALIDEALVAYLGLARDRAGGPVQ